MPSPLVSIVVPCFNYAHYLSECVESALSQTGVNDVEVVVINDASTDNTREVARRMGDPRVIYLEHETNRGVAHAVTTGMQAARGKYIAHIDADDRYRPDFLAETVPLLDRHPDVAFVYGMVASMNADGAILEDPWQGIGSFGAHGGRDALGDEFLLNLAENVIPAPAVIGRRELWLAALPFPDWFAYQSIWDWFLHLRVMRRHPVYFRAKTLADYRLHALNMHKRTPSDRAAEQTILNALDELLSGDDRLQEKTRLAPQLYACAYLVAASRYRRSDMAADARRCYLQAMRLQPALALKPTSWRSLAATLFAH